MASDTLPISKSRVKVALKPGYHLADWLQLTKGSGVDFSGRQGKLPTKVTMEELSRHNTKYDCWTAYNGKVYNISNYLPYHPGGEKKLLIGAGKDCTKEFNKYHPWVNIDNMLSKCYIGPLESNIMPIVSEDDKEEEDGSISKDIDDLNENINKSTVQDDI